MKDNRQYLQKPTLVTSSVKYKTSYNNEITIQWQIQVSTIRIHE